MEMPAKAGRRLVAIGVCSVLLCIALMMDRDAPKVASPTLPVTDDEAADTAPPSPRRAAGRATGSAPVASLAERSHVVGLPWVGHLRDLHRSAAESAVMWRAEERLVAECMKSRGFPYEPVPNDGRADADRAFEHVKRGDVDAARALGYGIAQNLTRGELPKLGVDPNAEVVGAMPPERQKAYYEALGGPAISPTDPSVRDKVVALAMPGGGTKYWFKDSCSAEARGQLYGDDYEDNELGFGRNELEREVAGMIQRDAAYVEAQKRWRGCMERRGHGMSPSSDIRRTLIRDFRAGTITLEQLREREIAAATNDAECYVEANVDAVEEASFTRAEGELVVLRQDRLGGLRAAQVEALARAESLLEELGPPE